MPFLFSFINSLFFLPQPHFPGSDGRGSFLFKTLFRENRLFTSVMPTFFSDRFGTGLSPRLFFFFPMEPFFSVFPGFRGADFNGEKKPRFPRGRIVRPPLLLSKGGPFLIPASSGRRDVSSLFREQGGPSPLSPAGGFTFFSSVVFSLALMALSRRKGKGETSFNFPRAL